MHIHTDTHIFINSAVGLHHATEEEVAALQTELSAFSLQPRVGLHWTHTHTLTHTYGCMHIDAHPFTNMHSHSDNAPIIGWTEKGGGG